MAVKDYNTDADLNTTISGINIAEGCPPSGINNAIRQLMADVKEEKVARDQAQTARDAAQDKAISDEVAARESAVSALDAAVVHKSGAETIAGEKTFSTTVTTRGSYRLTIPSFVQGELPSANAYWHMNLMDANNTLTGCLQQYINKDGSSGFHLVHKRYDDSASVVLGCYFSKDGTPYATAPSTPANSTGTQIVTADWLHSRGFGEKIPVLNTADANKLVTTGVYAVGSLSNGPFSGGNWFFVVERTNVVLRQIAYAIGAIGTINDSQIFTRSGKDENGVQTFGDWIQIMTSKGGTFTGVVETKNAFKITMSDFVQGTKPSANKYWHLNLMDANNALTGRLQQFINKGGDSCFRLCHKSYDNSQEVFLGCGFDVRGTPYGTAPTPAANSNTNHIATTAWVRGKGVLVESWHEGANWYRKYSDGWIEQGGIAPVSAWAETVSFHTPFTQTPTVTFTARYESFSKNDDGGTHLDGLPTTTGFTHHSNGDARACDICWRACGY